MSDHLRVLTWNARHGGGARAAAFARRLVEFEPDIAVITEFRNNPAGDAIREILSAAGLSNLASPETRPRQNSVLVAARLEFQSAPIPGLGPEAHRGIHARFSAFNLFALYFPGKKEKPPIFEAICALDPEFLDGAALLIGDLNTGRHYLDESEATFIAAEYFHRLEELGWIDVWRSRHPEVREFSWFSSAGNGFRLDHAFASTAFDHRVTSIRYSHREREEGLSDHSVLVLDAELEV